jgi:gas vesicle protein
MAYEYDRIEREDGGSSFLMGLLAGTVPGAGLGMLFAPKAGSETRRQLSEQATKLRNTANETYNQASEKVQQTYHQASERVGNMVDRGREAYDRARHASDSATGVTTGQAATGTTGYPNPINRP